MAESDKKWVNVVEYTSQDVEFVNKELLKPITNDLKKDLPNVAKLEKSGFKFTETQKILLGIK